MDQISNSDSSLAPTPLTGKAAKAAMASGKAGAFDALFAGMTVKAVAPGAMMLTDAPVAEEGLPEEIIARLAAPAKATATVMSPTVMPEFAKAASVEELAIPEAEQMLVAQAEPLDSETVGTADVVTQDPTATVLQATEDTAEAELIVAPLAEPSQKHIDAKPVETNAKAVEANPVGKPKTHLEAPTDAAPVVVAAALAPAAAPAPRVATKAKAEAPVVAAATAQVAKQVKHAGKDEPAETPVNKQAEHARDVAKPRVFEAAPQATVASKKAVSVTPRAVVAEKAAQAAPIAAETVQAPTPSPLPQGAPQAAPVQSVFQPVQTASFEAAFTEAVSQDIPQIDTRDADWLDTVTALIDDAAQVGSQEIDLALTPETLGAMKVRLEIRDGAAQVSIVTENPEAARLLNQHEQQLSELLERRGLSLGQHEAGSQQQRNQEGRQNANAANRNFAENSNDTSDQTASRTSSADGRLNIVA